MNLSYAKYCFSLIPLFNVYNIDFYEYFAWSCCLKNIESIMDNKFLWWFCWSHDHNPHTWGDPSFFFINDIGAPTCDFKHHIGFFEINSSICNFVIQQKKILQIHFEISCRGVWMVVTFLFVIELHNCIIDLVIVCWHFSFQICHSILNIVMEVHLDFCPQNFLLL
jgi:hypothetical protein